MNELTGADFKSATADDNKKLFIETYGCQMNVADSEVIASVMQMAGYSVAETLEEADAVFMNTCSIRDNAEQKILNRLEFFHSLKKKKKRHLKRSKTHRRYNMKNYVCDVCGYVYDPAVGDPDNGVAPGTAFENVPEDWVCPLCGVGKDQFSEE